MNDEKNYMEGYDDLLYVSSKILDQIELNLEKYSNLDYEGDEKEAKAKRSVINDTAILLDKLNDRDKSIASLKQAENQRVSDVKRQRNDRIRNCIDTGMKVLALTIPILAYNYFDEREYSYSMKGVIPTTPMHRRLTSNLPRFWKDVK